MKDELFVYDSLGRQTGFHPESQVNFNREQLLVTVNGQDGVTGFHADRFAGFLQHRSQPIPGPDPKGTCRVVLGFDGNPPATLTVNEFHSMDVDPANHLVFFRGTHTLVVVSFDFFHYYTLEPAAAKT